MRTRAEIKLEMTTEFMANNVLAEGYGFVPGASFVDEFSILSIENIIMDIVSFGIFTLELLFGQHKTELSDMLYNQKSGRLPWYRDKLLKFQLGFQLIQDTDEFDNTGATETQIEASRIIKYAAATEADDQSRVILKIAGERGGELAPITDPQREAVDEYISRFRYAGVPLTLLNYQPDLLYLGIRIYRDPLIIDSLGNSIIEGTRPVELAIDDYLRNLPFNGEFVVQSLVDRLQLVNGIRIAHPESIATAWIDPQAGTYGQPVGLDVKRIAESGYYKIADNGLQTPYGITYVV